VWGDWETVGCRRVHSGELHGECCLLNVTGLLNGMCGGLGNSWLHGVHSGELHGLCCRLNVTGRLDGMCGGIGNQLPAGECIVGSCMVSAADSMLLGYMMGCVGALGNSWLQESA
jgi:hypothetical protein